MTTAARTEFARDAVAYRHAFRHYLRDLDVAEQWRSAHFASAESLFEHDADRMHRLYTDGWNRFGWPEWAGGFGGTREHRMAYFDELTHARLPQPLQHRSLERFLPALIEHAPDLAASYLPRHLRGNEWWSTNAASWPKYAASTASDDGELLLRGARTWKDVGPDPTQLMVLARTDQPAHNAAATMFLVQAGADGCLIRRCPAAGNRSDIVEITIDDLQTSGSRVIGEAGAGVVVAQQIADGPRGLRCYAEHSRLLFDLGLLREAMAVHGSSQGQRQRFAQVYVDVLSAQALSCATIRAEAQGHCDDGVERVLLRKVRLRVSDLILDVGRTRIIRGTNTGGDSLASARAEWWYARAADAVHTPPCRRDVLLDDHEAAKVTVS
ncbi:acyl-CoA dehydrogenase [Nocardia gamkensis]|uniref:acyl-CoA dehydrogenase n=1 Tax=Nocardia gamkensis TaxID=352869 RepID=UPI0036EE03F0